MLMETQHQSAAPDRFEEVVEACAAVEMEIAISLQVGAVPEGVKGENVAIATSYVIVFQSLISTVTSLFIFVCVIAIAVSFSENVAMAIGEIS